MQRCVAGRKLCLCCGAGAKAQSSECDGASACWQYVHSFSVLGGPLLSVACLLGVWVFCVSCFVAFGGVVVGLLSALCCLYVAAVACLCCWVCGVIGVGCCQCLG